MVEPVTIDNLGLEASVRFAQDQEYLDQAIIKESPFISRQTKVDISSPFFTSEFDHLLQVQRRHQHWALFHAPQGFTQQRMRLFTHHIIPSLGSEELQQNQMEKIRQHLNTLKKERQREGADQNAGKDQSRDDRESATLLDLLEYLQVADKLLESINSRRNQYSKG